MTQKKLTVPFLTLRPGEYSSVSDAATAIIRYNLILNRLEVSLDSSPYAPFGAGGDGYLYDQLVAAPQVEPLLDGYVAYIDGYSSELNKVSIEDILSLGVGGGIASVGALSPLASTGGTSPVISFPSWPSNASGALSNDGYGNLSWSSSPGGGISGTIAATQIAFGTSTDTLGGESGLIWDTAQKLARVSNSGNYTDLLSTGIFAKAAGVGSNEIEINIDDGSGLPVITALNGATGGIVDLTPGSIRFREQSAAPAPSPFIIDVDSNTLELGTGAATGVEIGSVLAAVTISGAFTLPVSDGANGEVLATDGYGSVSWTAAPSTPPGGPADSVQINDGYGGFIGYSGLTWDNSQSTLTAPVLALAEGVAPAGTSARGKLWANSAADARPYWTDDTDQSFNLTLDRFNTLAPGATVIIDTDPVLPVFNSVTLNQDTTFATAVGKLGNGRSASVRVVCDGTTRSLTFPTGPGGWTWLGSGPPAVLAAGDVGYLSITAYGTADADVVAAWSYENMPVGLSGTGINDQVAIWSGPYTQDGSANFTFNGSNLGLVGGISQSAGAVTLAANAASSLTTSSGALTLTSAAAATWSTNAGNLTIVSASSLQLAAAVASEVVINDSGLASNFRVESDTNANMLFVDGTNNEVGIGTNAPVAALDLASGQLAIPDGSAAAPAIAFRDDLNTGFFSPSNDIVGVAVNGTEVARFQQSGAGNTPVMLMGTSTVYGAITVDSSDASGTAGVVMLGHAAAGTVIQESYRGGQFAGVRSRGTKAAPTAVASGDGLVNMIGAGWTATGGINYGGLITVKAEEAFTATASGGRIEFHTTLSGTDGFTTLGSATTERMRITNAGNVGIGTATPIAKLHSVGTNATAGYFFGGSLSGTSATLEAIGDISAGGNFVGQIAARSTLASGTARLLLTDTTVCRGQIQALQDTGDTTSGRLEFYTSLSGSRRFGGAFDSAGRFGVGTTAPASIITAQGASTTEWIRISSTAAGAGFADFYSAGTAGFQGPSGGVNTGSGIPFKINTEGVNRATFSGTEVVVNDPGNNYDLRVESQGNANMLFVDASANAVGIGTSTPSSLLSVGASSQFQVDSSGNLARINDIPYVFPPAQGAAGTILTNDGYGALSWTEGAAQATSAPISTKSSNYTLTTADGTILVNAASGGITITLPAAASATESIFTIKKKDVTFNIVTVAAAGAELIDGAATYPLSTQYEAIKIQSDGSAWWII